MTLGTAVGSLVGGILIGLAAWLLLALNGRVAGISGVLGRALVTDGPERDWRLAFLGGLLLGGLVLRVVSPGLLAGTAVESVPVLVMSGLLVGVGTQLANGCTSGHGVCGLGRRSPRSLAAVVTFMGAGMITVMVQRLLTGGAL